MVDLSRLLFVLLGTMMLMLPKAATGFLVRPSSSNTGIFQETEDVAVSSKSSSPIRYNGAMKRNAATTDYDNIDDDTLDIVLFGVGDLRVDDHGGLHQALTAHFSNPTTKVLPLVILDDTSLANIPGAISHTVDTAQMISAAVADLQTNLQKQLALDLQVVFNGDSSVAEALNKIITQQITATSVRVHVQDLGDADNQMGYGPYAQIIIEKKLPSNFEIVPWTCHLRESPWTEVKTLPDRYPDFTRKFGELPVQPLKFPKNEIQSVTLEDTTTRIPTADELVERMQSLLQLDPARVQAEANTGIFQSHWGGLEASTVVESKVLQCLEDFATKCQENDALWVQHDTYPAKNCPPNARSLEHATYNWMLKGTNGDKGSMVETNNLLAGEPMTRYLAAPLLLGTVSPRRIWYQSTRPYFQFASPLKTLVEGREWHKLLAAKNIRTRPEYAAADDADTSDATLVGQTRYGYWRWHGFLCRYAQTPLKNPPKGKDVADCNKEGVMFFHGFGASGTQWNKAMKELSTLATNGDGDNDSTVMDGLAPDLLGFGQSEKPPLSYSIYVWDSQCTDFIKEVATARYAWDSFIVGGNSIGGFSAASTAANECAPVEGRSLTSSGAPGTGKCQGVVLMNPAGPILSKEEVEAKLSAVGGVTSKLATVAQTSATGALPPCKPLPRPVARTFGNGLLQYLRPRIQSICVNLYPTNPAAVDEELCATIERDSVDPGGIAVMVSGTKLPPPRSMNEMLQADFGSASSIIEQSSSSSSSSILEEASFGGPVLVATGVLDPLNDAKGRGNGLAALRDGIEFDPINAGHCPHDELPDAVAASIHKWMSKGMRSATNPANIKSSPKATSAVL